MHQWHISQNTQSKAFTSLIKKKKRLKAISFFVASKSSLLCAPYVFILICLPWSFICKNVLWNNVCLLFMEAVPCVRSFIIVSKIWKIFTPLCFWLHWAVLFLTYYRYARTLKHIYPQNNGTSAHTHTLRLGLCSATCMSVTLLYPVLRMLFLT